MGCLCVFESDEGGATRRAELGHIVRMLDAALALFRRTVVPPPTEEGRVQLLLRATRRCTGEEIAAQGLAPGAPGRLAG